jgi:hypothetical protein
VGSGEFRVSPGSSTRTTPSTFRAARPRTRCTTWSPARSPPTWWPTPVPDENLHDTECPESSWDAEALRLRDLRAGPDGGASGRLRQREHRGRARGRDGSVLRRRACDRSVGQPRRRHRQGHRSGYGGLHREPGTARVVPGGRLRDLQRRIARPERRLPAVLRVRADRRPRQYRRCGPDRQLPVPEALGRRAGQTGRRSKRSGARTRRASGSSSSTQDLHVLREEGLLPDARLAGAHRGEAPLGVRGRGGRGRGEPLRVWAVHDVSALASQRAVHARRPHLLRRRVHVPDPRRARGRRTTWRSR